MHETKTSAKPNYHLIVTLQSHFLLLAQIFPTKSLSLKQNRHLSVAHLADPGFLWYHSESNTRLVVPMEAALTHYGVSQT